MSEPDRSVNVVNVATGVCFVALGVLLLMQRAGTIEMRQIVELWPLVLVIVGAAVVWQASRGGSMQGAGAGVGGLVWVVILGLVFSHAFDRRAAAEAAATTEGGINTFAVMGGARSAPIEGPFSGGSVTTVLGGTHLDLTRATLAPGDTAVVDLFTALGGTEIRVPAHWRVDIQTTAVAGGVTDQRGRGQEDDRNEEDVAPETSPAEISAPVPAAPQPRLIIQGMVVMGGVTIK
jgi:hypothetical protein